MKPNGTTYVTVGSHGFYYRETLSHGGRYTHPDLPPPQQPNVTASDDVATADVTQLVDSSSEKLISQLNRRATMHNPAWMLYSLSAIALITGLWNLSNTPQSPDLPDTTSLLLNSERDNNTRDEYSMLVGRYGEPDAVIITEPLGLVPVRNAKYGAADLTVTLVPNGCVETYRQVKAILPDVENHSHLARMEIAAVAPCTLPPADGWTIVDYIGSSGDIGSGAVARSVLSEVKNRRETPPTVDVQPPSANVRKMTPRKSAGKLPELKAQIQPNRQALAAESKVQRDADNSARQTRELALCLLAVSATALFAGILVHKRNRAARISRLLYQLDEKERRKFGVVQETIGHLASCSRVWRVEGQSATSDWKRNAGASTLVRRKVITVGRSNPPRVYVNLPVPSIGLESSELYFLPDAILYRERGLFGAISYDDLKIEQHLTTFIEEGGVPNDGKIIGSTWRYVNKTGGPDRRFNNNVQIPVVQYGVMILKSSRGLNIHLNTSNPQASFAAVRCWDQLNAKPQSSESSSSVRQRPKSASAEAEALQVLGLTASATPDEITAAYHHLAQMYHPDKVSRLGPELQSLADKKMREINDAYGLLRART